MAIFKCKMCGGALEINNETVATCEYCGTQQTLPKLDGDRKVNLYDRASHFRRNNEFDKAMGIYEQILNEDTTDAEAYWSLVLCRYGIEYVEDPASKKILPTVNRAQFTSVFDDDNYKSALRYADESQKLVYEAEANAINEIQKGILEISYKEKPFDVFICYKETDNSGRRTPDSVLATELYHELCKEGFKVFFSRITLEDKLGTAYEPYIFAALNSAKVMVVLGTKQEYFNAVWVKNEWSRYLALIKNGAEKVLIPAYRDMDPYDLPEEFSHLQAQDMSKLGFMQDLVRGIKKLTAANKPEPTAAKETIITNDASGNVTALLKRGFMALEDGEWAKADEFFEQCLNHNAELAEAYLGKLMAECKAKTRNNLADCDLTFDNSTNYQKVMRFGDEALVSELQGYIKHINKRNELNRLNSIYNNALAAMSKAATETEFKQAADSFKTISGYKNSTSLAEECLAKAEEKRIEVERNYELEKKAKKQAIKFTGIAVSVLAVIIVVAVIINSVIMPALKYNNAVKLIEKGDYDQAVPILIELDGYKDAEDKISEIKYLRAVDFAGDGNYDQAITIFTALGDYKDAKDKISEIKYLRAVDFAEDGNYDQAITIFTALGNYKDAKDKILETNYLKAVELAGKGDYASAAVTYGKAGGYKDAKEKSIELWDKVAARETVAAGGAHTVGVKSDGTVVAVGDNDDGQCKVGDWKDIVAVSAGGRHTVGLKSDGAVVAVGSDDYGQCDVGDWTDIVAVAAGTVHTVGLKSDGTVVAVGYNKYGQCNVGDWTDIVAVSAGYEHTVGLKSDGTVVAVGWNGEGQCDVGDWTDIVAVSAGVWHTVGLKSDGTVVAVGFNGYDQCKVGDWTDIVAVAAGDDYTVGLKSDGTVVSVGYNRYGQSNLRVWKDIIAVSAFSDHTVGLKSDGTVVAVSDNEYGQCDVGGWKDIKQP